jgi:hypothetical protein
MQRPHVVLFISFLLVLGGMESIARAQQGSVWGVTTSPNPHTDNEGVYLAITAHWDAYGGEEWIWIDHIKVEVWGSDGWYGSEERSVTPWEPDSTTVNLLDSDAGHIFNPVSYDVTVTPYYYDGEFNYVFEGDPGYGGSWVGYTPPPIPDGETTSSGGWWEANTTVHKWFQQLSPTSSPFAGRFVVEQDPTGGAGTGLDTCTFPGSAAPTFDRISTGYWEVDEINSWGPDLVGWSYDVVLYYRNQGRAPCDTSFPQRMVMAWPSGDYEYRINTLRAGITIISVWSERDGQYAERVYP